MDKLKRKIIKYFIICALLMSILESVWDSLFADVLFPRLCEAVDLGAGVVVFMVALSLFITFSIFALFAFLFYQLTEKAIEKESKRQVNERNAQYARVCHDLKTPMSSVQGFAAALRDDMIKPEAQKETFDIIYQKSRYMNELIESMFAYSQLDTDDMKLVLKEIDLCVLVRELAAMNYDGFETKGMDLQIEVPDTPIYCEADEHEVKRSIHNLIVNAYKHNPIGTKVLIQVSMRENDVYVVVADTGAEIAQSIEQSIFEPFVCGDESRTSGNGNGLGLAISQIIAQKHGGVLYVSKNIDGYTKGFVMKLPVKMEKKKKCGKKKESEEN